MKASLSAIPPPRTSLPLSDDTQSRQIALFLRDHASERFCLYTTDGKLHLAADDEGNRAAFASSSRKLIDKRLKSLTSHSPAGALLAHIRQSAFKSPSAPGTLLLHRSELVAMLEQDQSEAARQLERYRPDRLPRTLAEDFRALWPRLERLFGNPPRDMSAPQISDVGTAWAERCASTFWKAADYPSLDQLHRFKLLMQAEPDQPLVDALIAHVAGKLRSGPEPARIAELAQVLVGTFKMALSSGSIDWDETLRLGEHVMQPVGPGYEGGFGSVRIYSDGRSSPQFTLAMKSPLAEGTGADLTEACRMELAGNLLASSSPHDHVVNLLGAIRTESSIVILMEDCSNGKLDDVATKISDAHTQKLLDGDRAGLMVLTLAHDMLAGLDHLHRVCRVTHGDVKLNNVFLGIDGRAKIGDFDRTRAGESYALPADDLPKAIQFLSPEIVAEQAAYFEKKRALAGLPDTERSTGMAALAGEALIELSQSSDCFAAGIALYQLCYGVNPFDRPLLERGITISAVDSEDEIVRFASIEPSERMRYLFDGATIRPALARHEDELRRSIFSLMAPDPGFRASAASALGRPVFSTEGIGSQDIRDALADLDAATRRMPSAAT